MAACAICLRDKKPKFKTSRLTICTRCVTLLNEAALSAREAMDRLRLDLLASVIHKHGPGDRVSAWVDRKFLGILDEWCKDPERMGVAIKVIRAYRRKLVCLDRRYLDYPVDWRMLSYRHKHRDKYTCNLCHKRDETCRYLQSHHIVFRSRSGTNYAANIVVLCVECHQKQHPDHPISDLGGEPRGFDVDVDGASDDRDEELSQQYSPPSLWIPEVPTIKPLPAPDMSMKASNPRVMVAAPTTLQAARVGADALAADRLANHQSPSLKQFDPAISSNTTRAPASQPSNSSNALPADSSKPSSSSDGWKFWGACIAFFILFKACQAMTASPEGKAQPSLTAPALEQPANNGAFASTTEVGSSADELLGRTLESLSDVEFSTAALVWLQRHPEVNTPDGLEEMGQLLGQVHQDHPGLSLGQALDEALRRGVANEHAQQGADPPKSVGSRTEQPASRSRVSDRLTQRQPPRQEAQIDSAQDQLEQPETLRPGRAPSSSDAPGAHKRYDYRTGKDIWVDAQGQPLE